ncbi:MAG: hypothetical protein ACLP5E_21435 [Streptosporangiaceae bacterium]
MARPRAAPVVAPPAQQIPGQTAAPGGQRGDPLLQRVEIVTGARMTIAITLLTSESLAIMARGSPCRQAGRPLDGNLGLPYLSSRDLG